MTTEAQARHPRGRNGSRRYTAAEAAQRGQHAIADHRRQYGTPLIENSSPMPAPPSWFSSELKNRFAAVIASAPPGLLRAGDFENLVTLCVAEQMHQRVALEALAQDASATPEEREAIERRLRMASAAVGRISKTLGLTPPERARIGLPATPGTDRQHERWGLLTVDGGKAAA